MTELLMRLENLKSQLMQILNTKAENIDISRKRGQNVSSLEEEWSYLLSQFSAIATLITGTQEELQKRESNNAQNKLTK